MLYRLVKKMLNNKSMVLCLFIGIFLAVTMISTIPIYADGILQRMLTKDLEDFQVNTKEFPGEYRLNLQTYGVNKEQVIKYKDQLKAIVPDYYYKELGVPSLASYCNLVNDYLSIYALKSDKSEFSSSVIKIEAYSDLKNHIKIIRGKYPAAVKTDESYEVIVSSAALQSMDLTLDKSYNISEMNGFKADNSVRVKIVGVFEEKAQNDPYWTNKNINDFTTSIFMDYDAFDKDYLKEKISSITSINWYNAIDYHNLTVKKLTTFIENIKTQIKNSSQTNEYNEAFPAFQIIEKYEARSKQLKTTLWVLQIPILMMIAFYIFTVSQLIIDEEKNEISVLKSRGADRKQILSVYFLEGLVLSVIAMAVGPIAGLFLIKILGASDGFLEFVNRRALPLTFNIKAYLYPLIGAVLFIITMIIPAFIATKTTIIEHKRGKARKKTTFWKRYFLDFILVAAAIYGLYSYKNREAIINITGANGNDIPIDPMLFLISTLFIIGVGLVFLRVYPYIIRGVYRLGRKIWGPVSYTTLINLSRSKGKDQFLMIFLILTLSLGIYNANSARTINSNLEDNIRYGNGADIVVKQAWYTDGISVGASGAPQVHNQYSSAASDTTGNYIEPDYNSIVNLKEVDKYAKVLNKTDVKIKSGDKEFEDSHLIAIEPRAFGETAWFRKDLLKAHIFNYLNLMAKDPRAMLVSTELKKKAGIKKGDIIYLKIGENDYVQGIVFEFVDFWPGYNPLVKKDNQTQSLVVANLNYIQTEISLEPYELWIKLKSDATTQALYKDIKDKNIELLSITNTKQDIITKRNDPIIQGTNGALTMGFIITMIVTAIGFIIYWVIAIKNRTLQFGILRAMGLSFKEIIEMILLEQLLISGVSIAAGVIIGGITSDLFIPLLQMTYSNSDHMIPFAIKAYRGDYIKIYSIIALLLIIGIVVISRLINKIKINEALKLGED